MSPKELLYIEDALGHEKFSMTQCQEAVRSSYRTAISSSMPSR